MAKIKDVAIKYKVVKVAEDKYLLFPLQLLKGECDAFHFDDGNEVIPMANYLKDLTNNEIVADRLYSMDELEERYGIEYDGTDFLPDYFFDDYSQTLIYIDVDVKNDILKKNEVNIKDFEERQFDMTYFLDKKKPLVALGFDHLNELLSETDLKRVQSLLSRFKKEMEIYDTSFRKRGVTRVQLEKGEIRGFDLNKKINDLTQRQTAATSVVKDEEVAGDFSYNGLRKYIKERVFGHDEEIDTIAKILYLNKIAKDEDTIRSFLIVGPTGVGKTETVEVASKYLNIPYAYCNAGNLVPQGYKGSSIEDLLYSLYIQSNEDLGKAQKGLFFLDEYDKLNSSELELKECVKDVLLTFAQGGKITIERDNDSLVFDTNPLTKGYAGVFKKIYEEERQIGFAAGTTRAPTPEIDLDLREQIIKKEYLTEEQLSRIKMLIAYSDLDRATRKRIITDSKISELRNVINRFRRDYGIEITPQDEYIEELLDIIESRSRGMRGINNLIMESLDKAENEILANDITNKRLILTRETARDKKRFDII